MRNGALLSILLFVLLLTGCGTLAKEQTRLNTSLQVSEFNSLASQYYTRPTFVALNTLNEGTRSIVIIVDPIHNTRYDTVMSFGEINADKYIAMIDKYLKWENLASSRGDQFEKKIGEAKDGTRLGLLRFTFFSGNAYSHYLLIANCEGLTCVENSAAHYYDRENAIRLKSLITQMKNHQLQNVRINDIYR